MSVLDSRLIYITESEFDRLSSGIPGIVYKIKDKLEQPEYVWTGTRFVTNVTYPKGNIIDLEGFIVQNTRFGVANNYTEFDQDGVMVSSNSARTFVDIDFPIIARTAVANNPTPATLKGNITAPNWAINDYLVCEGQELIHGWDEGTTIYWHCHTITNGVDVTDRYTKWQVEWCWADQNMNLSPIITTTSSDILIPANTLDRTHIIAQIGSYVLPAKIGCHIYARLQRIASVGTAPTSNPFCSMLQIHVKINTQGSKTLFNKF